MPQNVVTLGRWSWFRGLMGLVSVKGRSRLRRAKPPEVPTVTLLDRLLVRMHLRPWMLQALPLALVGPTLEDLMIERMPVYLVRPPGSLYGQLVSHLEPQTQQKDPEKTHVVILVWPLTAPNLEEFLALVLAWPLTSWTGPQNVEEMIWLEGISTAGRSR